MFFSFGKDILNIYLAFRILKLVNKKYINHLNLAEENELLCLMKKHFPNVRFKVILTVRFILDSLCQHKEKLCSYIIYCYVGYSSHD
mgnify:CR=1 FL=1